MNYVLSYIKTMILFIAILYALCIHLVEIECNTILNTV